MSLESVEAASIAFHFLAVNLIDALLREKLVSAVAVSEMFDRAQLQLEERAHKYPPEAAKGARRYLEGLRLSVAPPEENTTE